MLRAPRKARSSRYELRAVADARKQALTISEYFHVIENCRLGRIIGVVAGAVGVFLL
jgi:hypothetical protein